MAKKHLFFIEAERLYTIEQNTLSEIATKLNISERTLQAWKQEGDWDRKKKQYLSERQSFHEELYVFARKLAKSIMDDWDRGDKVDPGRLYALAKLLPMILKVKDYEAVAAEKDEKVNIEDVLKKALSEAMGE